MPTHCTHVSVHAYICAQVYCVYVHFHVCTYMCTGVPCASSCICIAHLAYMPACLCVCMFTHVHIHACSHVCAHTCLFTHVHTYPCIFMCICVLCACACVCAHNCSMHFTLLEGGAESAPHPLPPRGPHPSVCQEMSPRTCSAARSSSALSRNPLPERQRPESTAGQRRLGDHLA